MITKYKTHWQEIEIVEVERETETSVWVDGRCHKKVTSFECYHDTEEDAKKHIIAVAEKEVERAQATLDYKKRNLQEAKNAKAKTPA